MALAKEELDMAARGEGILSRVKPDEPIFILRAQDALAPGRVDAWAKELAQERGNDHPKVLEARNLARMMRDWQYVNGCKVPD